MVELLTICMVLKNCLRSKIKDIEMNDMVKGHSAKFCGIAHVSAQRTLRYSSTVILAVESSSSDYTSTGTPAQSSSRLISILLSFDY